MKYIILIIVFSCFANRSFAQKDEKLRFLLTDTEQTDSAFVKTIIQRIYLASYFGKIKAYYDPELVYKVDSADFKEIGEFCETFIIDVGPDDHNFIDTTVCSDPNINLIETFSLKYRSFNILPNSVSVEFSRYKNEGYEFPYFWVNFNDLNRILNEKQITYLLESTKYLPLIEDY
ncbi:MAG: hypothetical protein ACXWW0_02685 [Bacteroidia bacterium]